MALAAVATGAPLLRLSIRPLLNPCRRIAFPGRVYCCSLPAVAVEGEPKSEKNVVFAPPGTPPELSIKEKKELASYAHSLGDKLKSQQVGKSGVTPNVAAAFVESLERNELLKLKVHNSCPGELPDVVKQLELMTGSVAVGLIGRTVILYRPSITKMKEAERKRQHIPRLSKEFVRTTSLEAREPIRKFSGRGRRGSSRFSSPSSE